MANGPIIRQSVASLENDPAALGALREAYEKMQKLSPTDNRSWIHWAGIHGFPSYHCWHHGRVGGGTQRPYDLFLPWHRAYLIYFEYTARDQNSDAAIPWWDWTSDLSHQIGVPTAFSDAQVGGQPNPLFKGPVPAIPTNPTGETVRFPGDPADLPTRQQVSQLLSLTSFVDFSSQLQDIHDDIHGWTGGFNPNPPPRGGDMGSIASSAFDPIFWSHHSMIDRAWYLWQVQNGVGNIPPDYLERPLEPFGLTVRDVLDIHRLGYEYAVSVASPVGAP